MSERNLLLIALSEGMRFPSIRGLVTTEDLFTMHLTAQNGFALDDVAKAINSKLKGMGEESFVEDADSAKRQYLTNQLEVVKFVIQFKQEKNKAEADRRAKRAKRAKLLEALDNRENAELASLSKEDILKQLEELD